MNQLEKIDIAKSTSSDFVPLTRVGMEEIEAVVSIEFDGRPTLLPAKVNAYVDLAASHKGIHMSRLYLAALDALPAKRLSPQTLVEIARQFLDSHEGLSRHARVEVRFDLPLRRTALKSDYRGLRHYKVAMWAQQDQTAYSTGVTLEVVYSSTCPCSAALSRQLTQKVFAEKFAGRAEVTVDDIVSWLGTESSVGGTPHGQRSIAYVEGCLRNDPKDYKSLPSDLGFIESLINDVEAAVQTPVQGAVKRADEQEFAKLNAQNLMFAEDAARRIQAVLRVNHSLQSYSVTVRHFESLHPHQAVATFSSH